MSVWSQVRKVVRKSMFAIVNKEFLIFLVFLCISGIFWLMMALNETYEQEFLLPVRLTDVPKNAVITTPMADTVRVTIKDKGYTLSTYMFSHRLTQLTFSFSAYASEKGSSGTVPSADIQRQVYQQLYSSSRITAVKPDHLTFYYNFGNSKTVDVVIAGKVTAAKNQYIARLILNPSKVLVYASDRLLDSIKTIATEPLRLSNIADTTSVTVNLLPIKGVKMVPQRVKVLICPDVLTEERMEVPVTAINMPEGKVLRTFPQRVTVSFVVGASQYRLIRPEQFSVVADYLEISKNPSDKCRIHLLAKPGKVSNARLEVNEVDYLIEQ